MMVKITSLQQTITDNFSKKICSRTSMIIRKFKVHMSRSRITDMLISDNGPNLVSQDFANFAKQWRFEQKT